MASGPCLSEDEILSFAQGQLASDRRAALEAHTRVCPSCEQLVGAALAASSPSRIGEFSPPSQKSDLPRGALVGRYTVLSLVGRGAMSEVYSAYDPELDRKVALKLLAPRQKARDPRAEIRLLREARAVARLSHPNVIGVYDAGRFGDRIFIAMEYVDGQTLAAWLREQPRTRREVLAVFSGAARGLAAAHASGLVHRDFKPENVLVARDGTARVTDFGLVRRLHETVGPESQDDADARAFDLSLTQPGELVGTPLYMAPEQFTRRHTDVRTDQFSFCVSLYEALYHEHPFLAPSETDVDRLLERVVTGRVRSASGKAAVPPSVRRVVVRGLARNPGDRWASMTELANALERDPARTGRRSALVAFALVAALAVVLSFHRTTLSGAPLCQGGAFRLADVWPVTGAPSSASPRSAALSVAFIRTGDPIAFDTAARVAGVLNRYAASWLAAYRDACEATHVRGEQSAEILDLRMQCLDERLGSLRALTDAFATPDAGTVRNAVDAANALPDLERCSDAAGLRAVAPPPPNGSARSQVDDVRRRAFAAKVAHDTGRHREAVEQGKALLKEARALGYAPLLAELLEMVGSFQVNAEFEPDTLAILEEATWTAVRVRRDDIAARCATLLAAYNGEYANRPAEAERWASLAGAFLDRMGPGHEQIRAWLLVALALDHQEDNLGLAQGYAQEAVTLAKRVQPPDHPDIGFMLTTLAEVRHRRGDDAAAVATVREARDVLVRAYGPRTAQVAQVLSNEGEYLVALKRPADALPLFRDSLTYWETSLGPNFRFLAYPLTGLGRALIALDRMHEARGPLERALRLREETEPRPIERAETEFALAKAVWADGEHARARKLAVSARDEYLRVKPTPRQTDEVSVWLSAHGVGR